MSQNSMYVRTFINCALALPASTSIMVRGPHGIGKSQIIKQVARKLNLPVTDRRLSQMSEGDVIGLPSTDGNTTRFNPPDWYKRACEQPTCLFLDELNRASPEVMQAAFQIVLDRELNGHKLHPETRVFTAINSSAHYNVNEVDPALLDRFWVVDLNPDVQDWLTWAKAPAEEFGGAIHPVVTDFIASEPKWLDPPKQIVDPSDVHPSRRSWERVHASLVNAKILEEPNDPLFYSLLQGYLGNEAAITFTKFAQSVDFRVSGDDICNKYEKVREKIKKLDRDRLLAAIDKVQEFVHTKEIKWETKNGQKIANNVAAFMGDLDHELRIALWEKLMKKGAENIPTLKALHKPCIQLVLDVFGVKYGDSGVNTVPNIPQFIKNKEEQKT